MKGLRTRNHADAVNAACEALTATGGDGERYIKRTAYGYLVMQRPPTNATRWWVVTRRGRTATVTEAAR